MELTKACLARIERLNPKLNAYVTVTAEDALAQARKAESEIQHGHWRGPLLAAVPRRGVEAAARAGNPQGWTQPGRMVTSGTFYAAQPSAGTVMVVKKLLGEKKNGPYVSAVINLTTLVASYGKQRTRSEFHNWLREFGFVRFEHWLLSAPRDMYVGWKE